MRLLLTIGILFFYLPGAIASDEISNALDSQIQGSKISVKLEDQKACEGLVKKARAQKVALFGGISVGAISGYMLANKKLGAVLESMQSKLQALGAGQVQGMAKLGSMINMKESFQDKAELSWVKGKAENAQEALKILHLDVEQFSNSFHKIAELEGGANVLDKDQNSIKQAIKLKEQIESLQQAIPQQGSLSSQQISKLQSLEKQMNHFISTAKPFVKMRERLLIAELKKAHVSSKTLKDASKKLAGQRRIWTILGSVAGGAFAKLLSLPMEAAITPIEAADGTLSAEYLKDEKLFNEDVPPSDVCMYGMQGEYKNQLGDKLSNVFTYSAQEAAIQASSQPGKSHPVSVPSTSSGGTSTR